MDFLFAPVVTRKKNEEGKFSTHFGFNCLDPTAAHNACKKVIFTVKKKNVCLFYADSNNSVPNRDCCFNNPSVGNVIPHTHTHTQGGTLCVILTV